MKSQAFYFRKRGLKVAVACSDTEKLNYKKKFCYKINFPEKIFDLFNIINFIKIFIQIKKLIKDNPSAIYYLHTPIASYFFRFFTFFDKLKIIYFVHGFRFTSKTYLIKKFFFQFVEKFLSFNTKIYITINNEDFDYVKFNFLSRRYSYKINGVGLSLSLNHFKKKFFVKKKEIKKILVIAAYKKEKGYFEILKLAELLNGKNIKIECFGYGNYSIFKNIKIKKKLNNIKFNKFDLNLKNKIKYFDILLHLSKREGLPVSIMQSLAEALPVICYNIRGNNDLIKDKVNGFFVKSFKDVPNKINYLNLNESYFNKMRISAFKSINKNFLKKKINLDIYKIINKHFIKN